MADAYHHARVHSFCAGSGGLTCMTSLQGALALAESMTQEWVNGNGPKPDHGLLAGALPRLLTAKRGYGPQDCERVVELIRTLGKRPTVDTYNALITAYGMRGDIQMVMGCLDRLKEDGGEPDTRTHADVAGILLKSDLDEGLQYIADLKQNGQTLYPDVTGAAVDALGKAGRVRDVVEFLRSCDLEMEIDRYTLQKARRFLVNGRADPDTAMDLLHLHIDAGLPLDMTSCRDFAAVLGRTGSVEDVRALLTLMRDLNITSRPVPMNLWWLVDGGFQNVCMRVLFVGVCIHGGCMMARVQCFGCVQLLAKHGQH
eukprot:m.97225 g.97225  ORF g.97225 m.97225 type:complete len:314 (-) comp10204_c0_seq8:977-1918(-)